MSEISRINAMLNLKCPRCRKGAMFKYAPFSIKFATMQKPCTVCEYDYMVEPGFFLGATYISYVFTVTILVITSLLLHFFVHEPELWMYMTVVGSVVLILTTYIFRLSRSIYIHLFGGVTYMNYDRKEYR